MRFSPYAAFTTSGTGLWVSSAMARTAATFISSLIHLACTSNAPRKMYGKPNTLLIWFGWSLRPVANMMSGREAMASSYEISGFGLAKANTIGFSFMLRTMSWVSTPATDNPRNTSAPFMASSKVLMSRSVANGFLRSFRSVRRVLITPFESSITMFSRLAPNIIYSLVHELAAAPAPLTTICTSSIFLPIISNAFSRPAAEIMAVPCWSSCMIGMSSSAFRRSSISKHSGALMSSRLIPPKVGEMALTV